MRVFISVILALSLSNIRCDLSKQKISSEKRLRPTEIFESYLQRKFGASIPDSLHYFILIPKFGCIGCMQKGLADLNQIITDEKTGRFTYIVSNRLEKVNAIYQGKAFDVLTDSTGELDLLNLRVANLMVVKTLNGQIQSTFYLNVDNLSEFPALFSDDQ